jgi:flagellar biosynthesis/type III secretory pathway protein FliH
MQLHDLTENDILDIELGLLQNVFQPRVIHEMVEWIKLAQARIKELEEEDASKYEEDIQIAHDEGHSDGYDAGREEGFAKGVVATRREYEE